MVAVARDVGFRFLEDTVLDGRYPDGWETRDTRRLIEGVGVTIEPGIYLTEFGVRSEIDIFMAEDGPVIMGDVQQEIIVIDTA